MNNNTGHGHVWERPDGKKARCGGPGICSVCFEEAQRYNAATIKIGAVVRHTTDDTVHGVVTDIVNSGRYGRINDGEHNVEIDRLRLNLDGEHTYDHKGGVWDGQSCVYTAYPKSKAPDVVRQLTGAGWHTKRDGVPHFYNGDLIGRPSKEVYSYEPQPDRDAIKVGSIVQHTGIPDLNGKVTRIVKDTFTLDDGRGYLLRAFRLTKRGEHVIVPGELYDGQTLVIAGTHSLCVDAREARQWVSVRRADVIAWRDEWLDNNTDNVTPFDQYLYSR